MTHNSKMVALRPTQEEWRDIPGLEGYYQASSLSRIRSVPRTVETSHGQFRRRVGKIISQSANANGYMFVGLCWDGKKRFKAVHRLVCLAFHGPAPDGQPHVAHNDGTRNNNVPENLRWASPSENMQDAVRHGTLGGGYTIDEETAAQIKARLNKGESQKAIYTSLGLKKWTVQHIARGLSWRHLEAA